jgi:hypothetical protein
MRPFPPPRRKAFKPPAPLLPLAAPPLPLGFAQQTPLTWDMGSLDAGSGGGGGAAAATTVGDYLSSSLERAAISDSFDGDCLTGWRGWAGFHAAEKVPEAPSARPPSPLEVLQKAWEMVVAETVVGSCTACVVTLDQHLNQLSYANVGDSGVMVLWRGGNTTDDALTGVS